MEILGGLTGLGQSEKIKSADRMTYRTGRRLGGHVAGLPVLETETVQLGSGRGEFYTRTAVGRDLVLIQTRVLPKMIAHIVPDPAWVSLMLTLDYRDDFLFNGAAARPGDVFISSNPSGYTTAGKCRNTLAIGIRRSRLERAIRALSGGADVPPLHGHRLALDRAQSDTLMQAALAAMYSASCYPLEQGRFILPETVESDFISLLSSLMLSQSANSVSRDPDRFQSMQIVRAAVRAHDAQRGEGVSLAQLCDASGVGHTWLSKCFHDVLGISPMAYLHARRLSEARARLLDQSNPPALVKDVALSLGILHFGRFAADYRARFKEKPSDTLATMTRK